MGKRRHRHGQVMPGNVVTEFVPPEPPPTGGGGGRGRRYPERLISMKKLEGGLYGMLEVIARDDERVGFEMGSDFVELTVEQVEDLVEALEQWLEDTGNGDGIAKTPAGDLDPRQVSPSPGS